LIKTVRPGREFPKGKEIAGDEENFLPGEVLSLGTATGARMAKGI
jgi:hypothetical protein